MGKQVAQGTRFESRQVTKARDAGRYAERLAKTSTKHEPDVRISGVHMRAAVAWEHWRKRDGKRRSGLRFVTITEHHFYELLDKDEKAEYGYLMQCKSTERVNVRTILDGLLSWFKDQGREAK